MIFSFDLYGNPYALPGRSSGCLGKAIGSAREKNSVGAKTQVTTRYLGHNWVMRTSVKVLSFACLLMGGAAAGYFYLVRVLQPAPTGVACPAGQVDDWRCFSYQVIVSSRFSFLPVP